jgi:tetratricopeptide (TPR) repeat protein
MRKPILFSINILVSAILVVLTQSFASAKTASEIEQTAKAVTVKIIPDIGESGTGIIAQKQGDVYTIITNAHVVCKEQEEWNKICSLASKYTIVTADNQKYQVLAGAVKKVPGDLDLAVIKIRSSKLYPIAQFANSAQVKNQDYIYTAGFPSQELKWKLSEAPRWKFGTGKVAANVRNRLKGDGGGYTMLYDSDTLPGMSGSGVFDSQGRVVAIHGLGDRYVIGTDITNNDNSRIGQKIGINRGIPINRFKVNSTISNSSNDNKYIDPSTADGFLIASYNSSSEPDLKNIKSSKHIALKSINKAINLEPNYLHAYVLRGWIYSQLKENRKALADYNTAVSINPSHSISYMARGVGKHILGDVKGSIQDYDKSIELNPNNITAIESRAVSYYLTGNTLKAISELNRVSIIDSRNIFADNARCILNNSIGRFRDAFNDCRHAIDTYEGFKNRDLIIKNYPVNIIYSNFGIVKINLERNEEGLADLDRAIAINPNSAYSYINRGNIKGLSRDNEGALSDLNNALNLGSTDINLYLGLAHVHDKMGHVQEAILYYSRSLDVYREQGASIFDRGLLVSGGLLTKVYLKYRILQLNGKLRESATLLEPKSWLEDKIEQGVLDLLGKPR